MPKVFLSPSTQEFNRTVDGNNEEYYANLIADAMIPYLRASNIEYGRNSPSMTSLEATQEANRGDYDFYLAIHSNAAAEPFSSRVRGAEIYYYPGSVQGLRAANIFANNYKQIYPQPENVKIIPLETLIELNKTTMPSILFEVAYHDNIADFAWMSTHIPEIGRNLALSVADYFGVPFSAPVQFARGTVALTSGSLNVRNAPSINAEITGSLPNGANVEILERENNWLRIRSNGLRGYVNSRFVKTD